MEDAAEDDDDTSLLMRFVSVCIKLWHTEWRFTWIMNMMSGFFGSYLEGFAPSIMPAWLAALDEGEEVVGFAVTVAVTMEVITLAMIILRLE